MDVTIRELAGWLKGMDDIAVFGHRAPDGDACDGNPPGPKRPLWAGFPKAKIPFRKSPDASANRLPETPEAPAKIFSENPA